MPKRRQVTSNKSTGPTTWSELEEQVIRYYAQYAFGSTNTSEYNISRLREMHKDSTIQAAMLLVELPILRAEWSIECENDEIGEFLTEMFKPRLPQILCQMLEMLLYGFGPSEKDFKVSDEPGITEGRLILNGLIGAKPEQTTILREAEDGSFAGIRVRIPRQGQVVVPAEKALVTTWDKKYDSLYGTPMGLGATDWFMTKTIIILYVNHFFEKWGGVHALVKYPPKKAFTSAGDEESDPHKTIAKRIGQTLKDNAVVTIPNVLDDDGNQLWGIDFLSADQRGTQYVQYLQHINKEMLRAFGVTDRMVEGGDKGSWAMLREQRDAFVLQAEAIMHVLAQHIDRYIIRQLVEKNFVLGAKANFVFAPLVREDREFYQQLANAAIQSGKLPIDIKTIADRVGIEIDEKALALIQKTPTERPQPPSEEPSEEVEMESIVLQPTSEQAAFMAAAKKREQANLNFQDRVVGGQKNYTQSRIYGPVVDYLKKQAAGVTNLKELKKVKLPKHLDARLSRFWSRIYAMHTLLGTYDVHKQAASIEMDTPLDHPDWDFWTNADPDMALDLFQGLIPVTKKVYTAAVRKAREHGFTVAANENRYIINAWKKLIGRAIAEKWTLDEFKGEIDTIYSAAGLTLDNDYHIETVFRTNLAKYYNAGKWLAWQDPAMQKRFPYAAYIIVSDEATTDICLEIFRIFANGVVRITDSIWRVIWPPNHFNCRSTVVMVSEAMIKRWGLTKLRLTPWQRGYLASLPAQGFNYNPVRYIRKVA